jgi:penicillin-binding protein 1A
VIEYISNEEYANGILEELQVKGLGKEFSVRADYAAEYARSLLINTYGENVYVQGLKVYTTINKTNQEAGYAALRKGLIDYDVKHGYRGPEGFVNLPAGNLESKENKRILDEALIDHPSSDDILSGVVIRASLQEVQVFISSGEMIRIKPDGLKVGREGLASTAQPKIQIKPGSIIRVSQQSNGSWQITQMPEVQGALIAIDPKRVQLTHWLADLISNTHSLITLFQAERQPGSSFKPFIYAAGIERHYA